MVTVLFADVSGSTALGEQLDPERLHEVLETYFAAMKEEIQAEGGTVEKYIGDAIVAGFGVPVAHEDDPARALRAALRMQSRLLSVNEELDSAHGVTLAVRIGVNTGEVLATIDPAPGDPMFTGDAVNVAARFEQNAEPGQIVTSERTARSARRIRYRELGPLELKGKSSAVRAFVVEGDTGGPDRGVPGLRAPMVGRSSELALLRSAYQNGAAEGRPHLVTIYGDAGVGKSRLTAEFLTWARTQTPEPTIVRGRCLPYGDGVTYWPLAEILKAHSAVQDTDPPSVTLDKIRAAGAALLTTDVAADPARTTTALAYTVGVEDPALSFGALEPRQVHAEMRAAWRSFFSALALRAPVVVVIEDIHWADSALLDLLEELAERVRGGVLFVCPSRPDLTSRRPGWGGGKRTFSSIALDPLTKTESDDLVTHLLAVEELPEAVRDRILERAEGNPFFLEEIIRQLIDQGHIVRSGERWRAAEGVVFVDIPDTVQGVLAARIDLLAPAEKRTLQLASVVGRVFWPGPVIVLLGGDDSYLYDVLGRLEARELVIERLGSAIALELEYIFKHVLTRDVAYDSLPRSERAGAHAAVAAWMERMAGERRGEFAELLAYHWGEAYRGARDDTHGDVARVEDLRGKAFEALMAGAEDARRRAAIDKATYLVDSAVALAVTPLEQAEALERKGMVALNDYRGDVSWASLREAAEIRAEQVPGDRQAIARVCSRAAETPTRWPGSMTIAPSDEEVTIVIDRGFANLEDGENEARVRLLTASAFRPFSSARTRLVEPEEALSMRRLAEEAAEMAERIERPDLMSAALDAASSTCITLGMFGDNDSFVKRRLSLVDRLNDSFEVGDIFGMAAWGQTMIGDYPRSIDVAAEGVRRSENDAIGVGIHCLSWQTLAEFFRGNWSVVIDELLPQMQAALGDRRDQPPYFALHAFFAAAFIMEAQGEPAAARPLAIVTQSVDGATLGTASLWMPAWLHLHAGRREKAEAALETLETPTGASRPIAEAVRAAGLAEFERWDRVPAFLEETRHYAADAGLRALPVHLDRLEGRAALAAGDLEGAIAALDRAADAFGTLGAQWERACTQLSLAEAKLTAGRRDEARLGSGRGDGGVRSKSDRYGRSGRDEIWRSGSRSTRRNALHVSRAWPVPREARVWGSRP